MKILKTIIAATVGLLGGPPAVVDPGDEGRKTPKPHPPGICEETLGPQIQAPAELPDDPAIPALKAIREEGLATILPATLLMGGPVETSLRGYTPGSRATIEARAGGRRVAIKAYAEAEDSTEEAALYEAFAAAGLVSDAGVRVPPLLAWRPDLRLLVIGWLEGPSAHELIERGEGRRAGELAARWLQRAASLTIKLGAPFGAPRMLRRSRKWVANLGAADPTLGTAATALIGSLERTLPAEGEPHLIHGTLYSRHVLDLGDAAGVIDWQRSAQGPLELDAGMFLASIGRLGLVHEQSATEAVRAANAFRRAIAPYVEERALAWHHAAALLRLTDKFVSHRRHNWLAGAHSLLNEAARVAAPLDERCSNGGEPIHARDQMGKIL